MTGPDRAPSEHAASFAGGDQAAARHGWGRGRAPGALRRPRLWAGLGGAGALVAVAGGLLLLSASARHRPPAAPAPPAGEPSDGPGFVSDAELVALMERDVRSLPERDRRFARYFTLTHLANAGRPADELRTARAALARLVNGLSWGRQVVPPRPLGPAGTVLRIDLRDYSWKERTWRLVLAAYPHGVLPDTAAARSLVHAAGGELPYVHGDWFVARAARPPLYHDLLGLPDNEPDLRKRLHIDGSEWSHQGRLIERHATPYGSYWRRSDFVPGGGEVVFNLPNGLHASMPVNRRTGGAVVRAAVEGGAGSPLKGETLESLLAREDDRHQRAVSRMGGPATGVEPVTAVAVGYERELDLTAAAAELGLRPAELSARLNGSAVLARALGRLKVPGGTVPRSVFDDAFADLVRELRLGTYLPPGGGRS